MPKGYISRWETFSSAHRLHNPRLSDETNRKIFGKCNWPNGHGHNYKVQVTIKGPIDPQTGMVINISKLKVVLKQVIDTLDHQNIDKDIRYFNNDEIRRPSTAENIAVYIWLLVQKGLKSECGSGDGDSNYEGGLGQNGNNSNGNGHNGSNSTYNYDADAELVEVRLYETEKNMTIFRGEDIDDVDYIGLP
ncbi:hypothetical protein H4219_005373 [Mycoemilia scoparia]|uniref:6-pyruvoyltetrahydropterin synthase n=1 Tax=Mycoemilia scoparia TaxID=417184 RepID=A0A9W7ZUV9_9FUNG|nr:hypothetical protein H4219_005373 [Mycoemilia scoparia]